MVRILRADLKKKSMPYFACYYFSLFCILNASHRVQLAAAQKIVFELELISYYFSVMLI